MRAVVDHHLLPPPAPTTTEHDPELEPELLTEDRIQDRIGRRVDVGQGHDRDDERTVDLERSGRDEVVEEWDLLGDVAAEVYEDAGDQHLHDTLARSDRVRFALVRFSAILVFQNSLLFPVEVLGSREQFARHDRVEDHLKNDREEEEHNEFG